MNTTQIQIKGIIERLDLYEKMLQEILLNTSKVKGKKKIQKKEECTIHLSFAGLSRIYEERKVE